MKKLLRKGEKITRPNLVKIFHYVNFEVQSFKSPDTELQGCIQEIRLMRIPESKLQ